MARLAVTGANGFVGRHLIAAARSAGWDVAGIVRSAGGAAEDMILEPPEEKEEVGA